jgi:hypothetical protein
MAKDIRNQLLCALQKDTSPLTWTLFKHIRKMCVLWKEEGVKPGLVKPGITI